MTETSFPIVGLKLSDAAWAQTVGAVGDGILDDWGNPYAITVNTNDTVTLHPSTTTGVARAVVNGFGHTMDANVSPAIPTVTSKATFWIGLLYDPSNAASPVTVTVLRGSVPPLSTGQAFLPLHQIDRAPGQTLAASKLYSPLTRLRPTVGMATVEALLDTPPTLFLKGTEAYAADARVTYRADGTLASPEWDRLGGGVFRGTRSGQDVGNASLSTVGGPGRDSDRSVHADFAKVNAGGVTLDEGDYVATATYGIGRAATGRSFVQIACNGFTARGTCGAGEDTVSVSTPLTVPRGGANFAVQVYQTTGGTAKSRVDVVIAKIA